MRIKNRKSVVLVLSATLLVVWGCSSDEFVPPQPDVEVAMIIRSGSGGSGGGTSVAAGDDESSASTGTGWGTLTGRIVYDGDPPVPGKLSTGGKDAPVCHADGVLNESLLVNPDSKGVKNVLVYARKVSRVHDSYADTADEQKVFDQKGCLFLNHVMPLRVSQPMLVKNSDPIAHNTNISPPGDTISNQLLSGGGEATYQFSKQQSAPVGITCNIHPWMKSFVLPRNDPYFAVTDENGNFEIANLPAGEDVELQYWHESAGGKGGLSVPSLTDGRGRVTIKLVDGETLDQGDVKVPPNAFK